MLKMMRNVLIFMKMKMDYKNNENVNWIVDELYFNGVFSYKIV